MKNDGTLWTTGENYNGQLGIGTNTDTATVQQVTTVCQLPLTIQETNPEQTISVFPNPTNGVFQVALPEGTANATVEVFNTLGEVVYRGIISTEHNSVNINVQAPGMYLIRVVEGEKVWMENVVKE